MTYFFENGLRKVRPYYLTLKTHCKGRWFKRTVVDVFSVEFRDRSKEYYIQQVKAGNFKIHTRSREIVEKDALLHYSISNGDIVEYKEHRHEPVVPNSPIEVVYEDESILVVDKPSGVPVHPTQKFFHNSVTEILKLERALPHLYTCHRLDKLTSGILIFAKDSQTATRIQKTIQDKQGVEKCYLARVEGEFPLGEIVCKDPITNIQTKKLFLNGVAEPKDAMTVFQRVKYCSEVDQSVVRCIPITGRTHQIRIHLRNLGHPICNDPLYGPGGLLSKVSNELDEAKFGKLMQRADENRDLLITEETCAECGLHLYKDYDAEKLVIWLHSLSYKLNNGLEFETRAPQWSTFGTEVASE